jgi:hypothetical protein
MKKKRKLTSKQKIRLHRQDMKCSHNKQDKIFIRMTSKRIAEKKCARCGGLIYEVVK